MGKWYEKVVELVQQAELKFLLPGSGISKKEFVVTALNALIDIPLIPEFVEAKLLDAAVELAVYIFNTYIWKQEEVEPLPTA